MNELDYKLSFNEDGVAWTTWNEDGYSTKASKLHIEGEDGHRALCGTLIPQEGNGVELDPSSHSGHCKRCEKKVAQEMTPTERWK